LRAGFAQVLCWLDRTDEAAAIIAGAAGDGFAHFGWDATRLATLTLYAEAAAMAGVTDAAATLYELVEPWAGQIVNFGAVLYGHARTFVGLLAAALGWEDRADEHFAFSCEFHEANDLTLWAARAHLGWAEALAMRGNAPGAREHATRVLELSHDHGYGLFEPRAAAIVESGSALKA
jgi:hypothetical protein